MKITAMNSMQDNRKMASKNNPPTFGCKHCAEVTELFLIKGGCAKGNIAEYLAKRFNSNGSTIVHDDHVVQLFGVQHDEKAVGTFLDSMKYNLENGAETFNKIAENIKKGIYQSEWHSS